MINEPALHLFMNSKPQLFMADLIFEDNLSFITWIRLVGNYRVEIQRNTVVTFGSCDVVSYKK